MNLSRRTLAACGAGLLLAGGLIAPSEARPAAPRLPAPIQPNPDAPYSASGSADLLTLDSALPLLMLGVTDLNLVHADATADSKGPVNGDAAKRTFARAANAFPLTVLGQVNLSDLLTTVTQDAPPDAGAPASDELLALPIPGVADLSVANADAEANWAGDGVCVAADEPLAKGDNEVATLSVLDIPGVGSLASLSSQGALHMSSTLSLPSIDGPGDARAVQSQSITQVAGIELLGGQVNIEVVGDPTLTATATGLPGGASIVYDAPLVKVNGQEVLDTVTLSDLTDPLLGALAPILEILDPVASVTVTVGQLVDPVENPNGTVASGSASVLTISISIGELLGAPLATIDLALAPMQAEAVAPEGGLNCGNPAPPTGLTKTGPDTVKPGDTFDYTITFPNLQCSTPNEPGPITNITAIDEVKGPSGTDIVSTSPTATSVTGATANGGTITITWDNLGSLEPGQSLVLTVKIKVPTTARGGQNYEDRPTIRGLCDGIPFEVSTFLDKPAIDAVLPATGGNNWLLWFGAAGLAGVTALGVFRRRRTATVT